MKTYPEIVGRGRVFTPAPQTAVMLCLAFGQGERQ
jgi:hypothetical protein